MNLLKILIKRLVLLIAVTVITQTISAAFYNLYTTDSFVVTNSNGIKFLNNNQALPAAATPANNFSISTPNERPVKKPSFKKRIKYFLLKNKLQKITKTGNDFNLPGLLLGILLAPIGVLAAYLFSKNKNLKKWAVIGCVIDIAAGILFILVLVTFLGSWN